MIIPQLSVFLENKSGRLTEVLEVLGKENIRITALKILSDLDISVEYTYAFSHGSKSIIILRCNNNEQTINALKEHEMELLNASELYNNYPFGLFAVPMSEIVRIHASSGTNGKSTVVGYTRNDISTWSEVTLVEPKMIERSEGKSKRVIDKRKY